MQDKVSPPSFLSSWSNTFWGVWVSDRNIRWTGSHLMSLEKGKVWASANCCVFMSVLRYTEEEIQQKVSTFRQMLMDKEGVITREGSHTQPVWVYCRQIECVCLFYCYSSYVCQLSCQQRTFMTELIKMKTWCVFKPHKLWEMHFLFKLKIVMRCDRMRGENEI